jgi:GNAT superfamily N-acetyltransferase
MQSLYAKYLIERTHDHIIETDQGFATYRYLNRDQVYIIDIYVLPEFRKMGTASKFADKICEIAKTAGCTELIGSVITTCKGALDSIAVLQAYGMKIDTANNNTIIFRKGI